MATPGKGKEGGGEKEGREGIPECPNPELASLGIGFRIRVGLGIGLGLVFRFNHTQWHYGAVVPLCTVVFYMDPISTIVCYISSIHFDVCFKIDNSITCFYHPPSKACLSLWQPCKSWRHIDVGLCYSVSVSVYADTLFEAIHFQVLLD